MDDYKEHVRNTPVCLECGDKIRYGRSDKKFCCEECRNRHNNRQSKEGRSFRRKVLNQLDRNYEILESLLFSGVTSADITELAAMGFVPDAATSCRRVRSRVEYTCFDIKYIMTPSRLSGISKIQNVSVSLQFASK